MKANTINNIDFKELYRNDYIVKPYYHYSAYLKSVFNESISKVSIDAGFTCPNRDGTIGTEGCIYCNNDAFKPISADNTLSIHQQINKGIEYRKKRFSSKHFIAYFQNNSNTYNADIAHLNELYLSALQHPAIVGIAISTRPDCIDEKIVQLIKDLLKKNYVSIEIGVESTFDETLELINRGHSYSHIVNAIKLLKSIPNIHITAHLIYGLPHETPDMMITNARRIANLGINAIKISQLRIVKNTPLENIYKKGGIKLFQLDEYLELITKTLVILPPNIVIQRLFGTTNNNYKTISSWGMKPYQIQQKIDEYLIQHSLYQAKNWRLLNGKI